MAETAPVVAWLSAARVSTVVKRPAAVFPADWPSVPVVAWRATTVPSGTGMPFRVATTLTRALPPQLSGLPGPLSLFGPFSGVSETVTTGTPGRGVTVDIGVAVKAGLGVEVAAGIEVAWGTGVNVGVGDGAGVRTVVATAAGVKVGVAVAGGHWVSKRKAAVLGSALGNAGA